MRKIAACSSWWTVIYTFLNDVPGQQYGLNKSERLKATTCAGSRYLRIGTRGVLTWGRAGRPLNPTRTSPGKTGIVPAGQYPGHAAASTTAQ